MRYLSVCSGIEAASVAWEPLGWESVAFSEIDPFACAVLRYRFPSVPNLGSMLDYEEWTLNGSIDVLVGGTPCQSFSVAGMRRGLDDERGNLALVYCRLLERFRPTWFVWENVPGVLSSSGGRDFGSILGAVAQLGYGFAYRVLDAQYFGVPQRRRRVFLVGHIGGDWRPPAAVLFEPDSLRGDFTKGKETRKDVARTLRGRSNSSHREDSDNFVPVKARTLSARNDGSPCSDRGPDVIAHAVLAKGGTGRLDPSCETFVPITGPVVSNGSAAGSATGQDAESGLLVACTLPASDGGVSSGMHPVIAFDTTQITSKANRSNPKPGDPCHPLASQQHPPAIAFDCRAGGDTGFAIDEKAGAIRCHDGGAQAIAFSCKDHAQDAGVISPTLRAMTGNQANGGGQVACAFQSSQSGVRVQQIHATLDSNNGPRRHNGVLQSMQVRRLTPMECERLQGFPDNWTLVTYRKKQAKDGPRYRAIGNSMAVPVMFWLGKRIQLVSEAMQ